ncbi:MAG: hypothetical protein Q9M11_04895 [Mariprofundaceae bacterium]|nr:hypothetical protein [Mariprofundaceae bacterium]
MMKKHQFLLLTIVVALLSSGCASMHDGEGWEHMGDSITHQNRTSSVFEHRH